MGCIATRFEIEAEAQRLQAQIHPSLRHIVREAVGSSCCGSRQDFHDDMARRLVGSIRPDEVDHSHVIAFAQLLNSGQPVFAELTRHRGDQKWGYLPLGQWRLVQRNTFMAASMAGYYPGYENYFTALIGPGNYEYRVLMCAMLIERRDDLDALTRMLAKMSHFEDHDWYIEFAREGMHRVPHWHPAQFARNYPFNSRIMAMFPSLCRQIRDAQRHHIAVRIGRVGKD